MIYFDTSALVKLIRTEAETSSFQQFLLDNSHEMHATSALGIVEIHRAAMRIGAAAQMRAFEVAEAFGTLALTPSVLARAAAAEPASLRTLDAIHISTALLTEASLLVTYDKRMTESARLYGLSVASPGAADEPLR
ncbi:type II toxin-antitoxin system VapC family toxin [Arthrobacter sp. A5]|uniref:type II toxin-antitoxin system VapC family toxin n=1 Tax=Arthrobacter sp. A5 TaxID=576926 RepID=UPI003DA93660